MPCNFHSNIRPRESLCLLVESQQRVCDILTVITASNYDINLMTSEVMIKRFLRTVVVKVDSRVLHYRVRGLIFSLHVLLPVNGRSGIWFVEPQALEWAL